MRKFTAPLVLVLVVAFGALAATLVAGNSPELGLDLQGGASVVLQPPEDVDASGQPDQAIQALPPPRGGPRGCGPLGSASHPRHRPPAGSRSAWRRCCARGPP